MYLLVRRCHKHLVVTVRPPLNGRMGPPHLLMQSNCQLHWLLWRVDPVLTIGDSPRGRIRHQYGTTGHRSMKNARPESAGSRQATLQSYCRSCIINRRDHCLVRLISKSQVLRPGHLQELEDCREPQEQIYCIYTAAYKSWYWRVPATTLPQ